MTPILHVATSSSRKSAGMSLISLMVTIGILSIVMYGASQLFRSQSVHSQTLEAKNISAFELNQLSTFLRAEYRGLFQATEVELTKFQVTVPLTNGSNPKITYSNLCVTEAKYPILSKLKPDTVKKINDRLFDALTNISDCTAVTKCSTGIPVIHRNVNNGGKKSDRYVPSLNPSLTHIKKQLILSRAMCVLSSFDRATDVSVYIASAYINDSETVFTTMDSIILSPQFTQTPVIDRISL